MRISGLGRVDSLTLVATGMVAANVRERIAGLGRVDSLTLVATGMVAANVRERIAGSGGSTRSRSSLRGW